MARRHKQRSVIVFMIVLTALVTLRHFILRSGFSLPGRGGGASFSFVAPRLPRGARTQILRSVRTYLETGSGLEVAEQPGAAGRRVAVISLTRQRRPAAVSEGRGPSLRQAIRDAADALAARTTPEELRQGRLEVQLAVSGSEPARFTRGSHSHLDDGLEGLWLRGPDLLLLPEEILSRRLVSSEGELRWPRLRDYLAEGNRGTVSLKENPGREGDVYVRVLFDSFMEGGGGLVLSLYRGNDRAPELSPRALLEAARRGGEYLLRHQRGDGSFAYSYDPTQDSFSDDYSLLRHAGACYALVELFEATNEQRFLEASRRALEYLLAFARPPKPEDAAASFEAIVSPGEEAELGGAALAVLALVRYQQASADDRWAERASKLARFLLHQQEESGRFRSKYFYGADDDQPFESIYYPGEAILALVRLDRQAPQARWRAAARRGADWLIGVRDAGKSSDDLPHDHWLLMALDELHAATGEERYAAHAERIARAIVEAQRVSSPNLDWIGTFYDPPRSTPTATRAEALVAMHRLAARRGSEARPYFEALLRMAAFERRCQLTVENTLHLPRPDKALGGFRRGLIDWKVRIDYVQHNVSALLGLRSILLERRDEQPT